MDSSKKPTNYPALYTLISVFFFWGFIAASNGVFIPFCKSYFNLTQFQSQLVDSAFYFAYYIGAFLLFISSVFAKKDILNGIGFKNGIVYGLLISVVGAFFMFPALASNSFALILASLFIIALGFSLQQTAGQPFTISLGDESTGSHRLNLAGGINSFGTTIGPIIFALALLGTTKLDQSLIKGLSLSTIQWLYVFVGLAFLIAGLLFKFSKSLPDAKYESSIENENKATVLLSVITVCLAIIFGFIFYQNTATENQPYKLLELFLIFLGISILTVGLLIAYINSKAKSIGWGALKFPQLVFGMIGIFIYVGVEVAIQSNLGEYLKHLDFTNYLISNASETYQSFNQKLNNKEIVGQWSSLTPMLVSLYWGSLMIGRWAGAISVFNWKSKKKKLALIIVPYIAFLLILLSNIIGSISKENLFPYSVVKPILPYALIIIIQIIGFFVGQEKPIKTFFIFGILGIIAMLIGIFTNGSLSVFAFVSGGLFCSVLWPCIFSLATQGLGKYTSQGSAFLIMMILGGALIPPLQGKIADLVDIKTSYWVPVLCFTYLAMFALIAKKILNKQGLNPDNIN